MTISSGPKIITTNEDGFIYFYINGIKRAFVDSLRGAFAHKDTPARYRYDPDTLISQVDIRSDYPERQPKPLMIVVEVGNGNANVTYVGDEFNRIATLEEDGIDGYEYGGKLLLNVNIKIYADKMRDAEHLSDLVTLYMRYLFRNLFYAENLAYVEVNVGKISEEGDQFTNTIGTEITAQFDQILSKDLYETIQNINISFNAGINNSK